MLGWEVYVRPEDESVLSVAAWESRPGLLTTMETLVENGDAEVVEYHGGYPDIYRVKASLIRYWCEDDPQEMCKMWNGTGYANWAMLDDLAEDATVLLEMWDGS